MVFGLCRGKIDDVRADPLPPRAQSTPPTPPTAGQEDGQPLHTQPPRASSAPPASPDVRRAANQRSYSRGGQYAVVTPTAASPRSADAVSALDPEQPTTPAPPTQLELLSPTQESPTQSPTEGAPLQPIPANQQPSGPRRLAQKSKPFWELEQERKDANERKTRGRGGAARSPAGKAGGAAAAAAASHASGAVTETSEVTEIAAPSPSPGARPRAVAQREAAATAQQPSTQQQTRPQPPRQQQSDWEVEEFDDEDDEEAIGAESDAQLSRNGCVLQLPSPPPPPPAAGRAGGTTAMPPPRWARRDEGEVAEGGAPPAASSGPSRLASLPSSSSSASASSSAPSSLSSLAALPPLPSLPQAKSLPPMMGATMRDLPPPRQPTHKDLRALPDPKTLPSVRSKRPSPPPSATPVAPVAPVAAPAAASGGVPAEMVAAMAVQRGGGAGTGGEAGARRRKLSWRGDLVKTVVAVPSRHEGADEPRPEKDDYRNNLHQISQLRRSHGNLPFRELVRVLDNAVGGEALPSLPGVGGIDAPIAQPKPPPSFSSATSLSGAPSLTWGQIRGEAQMPTAPPAVAAH